MFNAMEFLEQTGGAGFSEGWHEVSVESVYQKTSARGNAYVSVTLAGTGGKVYQNLNINHHNPKADEIARRELAQLMIACGCNSLRDPMNPVELHGKRCQALLEADGSFFKAKMFKPVEKTPSAATPVTGVMPGAATNAVADDFEDSSIPF